MAMARRFLERWRLLDSPPPRAMTMERSGRLCFHTSRHVLGSRPPERSKHMTKPLASLIVASVLAAMPVLAPAQAAETADRVLVRHKTVRAHGAVACSPAVFVAAERGDPRAQAQLGFWYANGRCVPQGYYKAAL